MPDTPLPLEAAMHSPIPAPRASPTSVPAPVLEFGEATRYAVVSALALLLDVGVMAALVQWAGWPPVAASALGFGCGLVLAYGLSRRWAFRGHTHREVARGLVVFGAIGLGGLLVNAGLVWAATAAAGLAWPAAKFCAAAGSFVFNYTMRKRALYSGTHQRS